MSPSEHASLRDVVDGSVDDVAWRVTRWRAPIKVDPDAVAFKLEITWPDGNHSGADTLTSGSAGREEPHFLAVGSEEAGLAILAGRCPRGVARVTFSTSPATVLYPDDEDGSLDELLVVAAVPMTEHPIEATMHDHNGRQVSTLTIRL